MVDKELKPNIGEKCGTDTSPTSHVKINVEADDYSSSSEARKSARSSGNTRTTYNYVNMIVECILGSPTKRVLLSDIYKHVQNNYKDMIDKGVDWQNGIRHNLSLNDCFMKDGRNPNGKGYFWTVAPKNLPYFEKGDFRRRWSQCRTRRQRDGAESRRQSSYMLPANAYAYPAGNVYQKINPLVNNTSASPSGSSYYERRNSLTLSADPAGYTGHYIAGQNSQVNPYYANTPSVYYQRPYYGNYPEQAPSTLHPAYYPYSAYSDPCNHSSYSNPSHSS
ncbi:hypothetical protein HZS_8080, partial [Henneguya salminicola]